MERRVVYLANPCAPGRNPEPAARSACRATLQMVEAGGVSRMLERCGQGARLYRCLRGFRGGWNLGWDIGLKRLFDEFEGFMF